MSLTIEKCSVQEKKVVGDKRSLMAGSLMTGSTVLKSVQTEMLLADQQWPLSSIINQLCSD